MLFRVTACIRSSLHASRWISLSCSLACKTPWRGRKLNEIYVLTQQCGNLCCAVERGCYHIIIKLRWADQMWNLDKECFEATWLSLWLALLAEQGELQAAQNAPMSSSHYLALIWACLISAPCDLTLAHPGLPQRAPMCCGKSRLLRNTDGVVLSIPPLSGCFWGKEGFLNITFLSFYF